MILDDRSNSLLKEILSNPDLKNIHLEQKFNLSRRQISYSFQKVNEWLESQRLPKIERTKQGLFLVPVAIKSLLNKETEEPEIYYLSEKERAELIILILLGRVEEFSLYHFSHLLEVSKNTILNDLKLTKRILEPYQLKLFYSRQVGYTIEGDELSKRRLMIDSLHRILKDANGVLWLFKFCEIKEAEIAELRTRIEKIEKKLRLTFTDEKVDFIPFLLAFIFRRHQQHKVINNLPVQYEELYTTEEFAAVEELLNGGSAVEIEEKLFITLYLLSSNLRNSDYLKEEFVAGLRQAAKKTLHLFERNACIFFKERDELLERFVLHLKPAYYRIKFDLHTINPLQKEIEEDYKEIHHLVRKSLMPLLDFIGTPIPDSEIAYLTILLGGWLKRYDDSLENKIKAIIVCPRGLSISKLIEANLRELFPEFIIMDTLSMREFNQYDLEFDIVFSPVPLKTSKSLFIIKDLLGSDEKLHLRNLVMKKMFALNTPEITLENIMNIIEKHAAIRNRPQLEKDLKNFFHLPTQSSVERGADKPSLTDLIRKNHISLFPSAKSVDEAIQLCAAPLLDSGSIEVGYIDAMIDHYHASEPYMMIGPYLAIPHASPDDGVNSTGMGLIKLEEPVEFAPGKLVHIIIVLAPKDRDYHLRALLQLAKLAENRNDIEKIIQSGNTEDIYSVLDFYSNLD